MNSIELANRCASALRHVEVEGGTRYVVADNLDAEIRDLLYDLITGNTWHDAEVYYALHDVFGYEGSDPITDEDGVRDLVDDHNLDRSDAYTHELLAWLKDGPNDTVERVQDAIDDGTTDLLSAIQRAQAGYAEEINHEVGNALVAWLDEHDAAEASA